MYAGEPHMQEPYPPCHNDDDADFEEFRDALRNGTTDDYIATRQRAEYERHREEAQAALAPQHQQHLQKSAIDLGRIATGRYRSYIEGHEAYQMFEELGFYNPDPAADEHGWPPKPGLLIEWTNIHRRVSYQFRPDRPYDDDTKYIFPLGHQNGIYSPAG
jgi:hypothetical protein